MLILTEDSNIKNKPCVATIGIFDGVHKGHKFLIDFLKREASVKQLETTVITFLKHPRMVLGQHQDMFFLNTLEEKIMLLEKYGIDNTILLNFTMELSQLTAKSFIELLYHKYNVKVLVIGHDHRFGKGRKEGFDDYLHYGKAIGMEVVEAPVLTISSDYDINSSSIRKLLIEKKIKEANNALGYKYSITGKVVKGFQEGRKMGFPTANIQPYDLNKIIPGDGVYAVRVKILEHNYQGMLCIGNRPTMNNGNHSSIEVNIFDFTENIYHHEITIIFEAYMRPSIKYNTINELIEQLHKDEVQARQILSI